MLSQQTSDEQTTRNQTANAEHQHKAGEAPATVKEEPLPEAAVPKQTEDIRDKPEYCLHSDGERQGFHELEFFVISCLLDKILIN